MGSFSFHLSPDCRDRAKGGAACREALAPLLFKRHVLKRLFLIKPLIRVALNTEWSNWMACLQAVREKLQKLNYK